MSKNSKFSFLLISVERYRQVYVIMFQCVGKTTEVRIVQFVFGAGARDDSRQRRHECGTIKTRLSVTDTSSPPHRKEVWSRGDDAYSVMRCNDHDTGTHASAVTGCPHRRRHVEGSVSARTLFSLAPAVRLTQTHGKTASPMAVFIMEIFSLKVWQYFPTITSKHDRLVCLVNVDVCRHQ